MSILGFLCSLMFKGLMCYITNSRVQEIQLVNLLNNVCLCWLWSAYPCPKEPGKEKLSSMLEHSDSGWQANG